MVERYLVSRNRKKKHPTGGSFTEIVQAVVKIFLEIIDNIAESIKTKLLLT